MAALKVTPFFKKTSQGMLRDFFNRKSLNKQFPAVTFGRSVQVIGSKGVRLGKGSCIGAQVWINDCIRDGQGRIIVGKNVLVGRGSMLSTSSQLEISDFTLIGPNCCLSNADHSFQDVRLPVLQQGVKGSGPLIVEENCWFGFGAIVPKGVLIGRGSIVGAGAVVLEDVPAFCMVVGCPARVVKFYDFSENRWRNLPSESDRTVLQQSRANSPPPSRETYAMMLHANNVIDRIDPCLAGP